MKLEMRTLYATSERSVQPGQQAVFPREEAEALIAGGFAVPVDDDGEGKVRTRPVPQPPKRAARGGKPPAAPEGPGPADPPTPEGPGPADPPTPTE
ncbi:hypothetical protein ACGFIV_00935 [Sphaerisporangium sp. NPDC049003]|uniref:hypothetical protein n=1 Tax=Sphaerisporangium sp. NPDC049003 TaxID=3364517 RepID=UPI0037108446